MKKILLTGATGVIGRRVVPELVRAGHEVLAVARTREKAAAIERVGAEPITLDLFDADRVSAAVAGRDAVVHLATNIPLGVASLRGRNWAMNDRLRTEAADHLAAAVINHGAGTYVGESITFPYLDGGVEWIDETQPRDSHSGNESVADAEAAAQRVTDGGASGVILRFAMFHADDSGHMDSFLSAARRGFAPFVGVPDGYQPFIDVGDAARAVVAALDIPAGVYNVTEHNPTTRAEHATALARVVGRERLRFPPRLLQKLGGAPAAEFGRSQRVSSAKLQSASSWRPAVDVVTRWKDLT